MNDYGLVQDKDFYVYPPAPWEGRHPQDNTKPVQLPIGSLVRYERFDRGGGCPVMVKFVSLEGQYKDWYSHGWLILIRQISPLELLAREAE